MTRKRLSLSRVNFPPDLAQAIMSVGAFEVDSEDPQMVLTSSKVGSELASAATLVGETSTPKTKPQVVHVNTPAMPNNS